MRGQAAINFLLTYGWAILVMVAVIAGITALDPLGAAPGQGTRCDANGPINCDDDKTIATEDGVNVPISNDDTEAITVSDANLTTVNGDTVNKSCTGDNTVLTPGETTQLQCTNVNITSGQQNDASVNLGYYPTRSGPRFERQTTVEMTVTPGEATTLPDTTTFSTPHTTPPTNLASIHNNLSGSGTQSDPYLITNDYELQSIDEDTGAYYAIANNIDASGTDSWDSDGFEPIADGSGFSGGIYGRNHQIKDLYINSSGSYNGLIGSPNDGSFIHNLDITNIELIGGSDTGPFGGVTSADIINVTASGTVLSGDDAGGIVGNNQPGGLVRNAHSKTDVTVTNDDGGGITGEAEGGTIEYTYATGSVTGAKELGGLAGNINDATGSIKNSFAANTITITGSGTETGGAIGNNSGSSNAIYWDTQTTGLTTSDGGTGLTTSDMQGSSATTNMGSLDYPPWQTTSGYPELTFE